MENPGKTTVTVAATVNAPAEKVWELWTSPQHIIGWNSPSDEWHTPYAENDLKEGGRFLFTMAAKDGSASFDFNGEYTEVVPGRKIAYTLADGRKVSILFDDRSEDSTTVTETFETENTHPVEMQQAGWQAILDNFRRYAESR